MADVSIERTVTLSRADMAQWFTDLGKALRGDGKVSVRLGDSTVEVAVPDQLRFEAEIEVDGDEVEVELELTWSTTRPAARGAHPKSAADA